MAGKTFYGLKSVLALQNKILSCTFQYTNMSFGRFRSNLQYSVTWFFFKIHRWSLLSMQMRILPSRGGITFLLVLYFMLDLNKWVVATVNVIDYYLYVPTNHCNYCEVYWLSLHYVVSKKNSHKKIKRWK